MNCRAKLNLKNKRGYRNKVKNSNELAITGQERPCSSVYYFRGFYGIIGAV